MEADFETWKALWERLGASGDPEPVFDKLAAAYGSPGRCFHTLWHIGKCLEEFARVRDLAEHPDEAEFALWFHDCFYDTSLKDALNVERSADSAAHEARKAGLTEDASKRIWDMVMATAHISPAEGHDPALAADSDLASLGWNEAAFDEGYRRVREERAHIPDDAFKAGHARFCRNLLARPAIYLSEPFKARYEAQARKNLSKGILP